MVPMDSERQNSQLTTRHGELCSDEPIRSRANDLLGRAKLADTIAQQIRTRKSKEPIIIGLNAPWGAGKSSFLNLLEDSLSRKMNDDSTRPQLHLREADARPVQDGFEQDGAALDAVDNGAEAHALLADTATETDPLIIHFNPWLYGSIEQLVAMFFAELTSHLAIDYNDPYDDLNENQQDAIARRHHIAKQLEAFSNLAMSVSVALPTQEAVAAATASGAIAKYMVQRLKGQRKQETSGQQTTTRTLNRYKQEIDIELGNLNQTIVVFVDDIDRLERRALRLLFRMVRLIANFRNIVYILAYDRLMVERQVARCASSGRKYLEKIIQVSYDIPAPHPKAIHHLLRHELDDVRSANNITKYDAPRYGLVFGELATHFTTLRSVKRYVNAIRLALPPIAEKVDLIDFYVIELFRLFYPELHNAIADERRILVTASDGVNLAERRREFLNKWFGDEPTGYGERVSGETRRSLRRLVCGLFPVLDAARASGRLGKKRLGNRVCSPSCFETFFLVSVPTEDLTDDDHHHFRHALEAPNDVAQLVEAFRMARMRGKVPGLLRELAEEVKGMDPSNVDDVAQAICDCDARDDLQLSDRHRDHGMLSAVVYECTERKPSMEKEQLLFRLIRDGRCLFTVGNVFDDLLRGKGAMRLEAQLGGEVVESLKEELRDRIVRDAAADGFWDGDRCFYLLSLAGRFGGTNDVSGLLDSRLGTGRDVMEFIRSFWPIESRGEERSNDLDDFRSVGIWLLEEMRRVLEDYSDDDQFAVEAKGELSRLVARIGDRNVQAR